MSTSAIASSSLLCVGASLTGASTATLELGATDSAFAEFLSSLVSVGTEDKTAAGEAGTCTEPDVEMMESHKHELRAASDSDSEKVEDTSSQHIAQVFASVAQLVPQATVDGTLSSESLEDGPAREVAGANDANGVSNGAEGSENISPDLAIEGVDLAVDTKRKSEASFLKVLDHADDDAKRELSFSRVPTLIVARQPDGQTDPTRVEKIGPTYSSDQIAQNVQPPFHSVVDRSVPASKPNLSRSMNENPVALARVEDASAKSIVGDISSTPVKDRLPAQRSGEKRGEPFSERNTALHPQNTAPVATSDSGESLPSDMKVSPHVTHETFATRSGGTAREMQVALDTDMGRVHIRAELGKGDRVNAVVQADHKETGVILAEQAPALERALAEKDILLGSFQVADATASSSHSSNHSASHRSQLERPSVATTSGSNETATRDQESYEPEERKLSVRV